MSFRFFLFAARRFLSALSLALGVLGSLAAHGTAVEPLALNAALRIAAGQSPQQVATNNADHFQTGILVF